MLSFQDDFFELVVAAFDVDSGVLRLPDGASVQVGVCRGDVVFVFSLDGVDAVFVEVVDAVGFSAFVLLAFFLVYAHIVEFGLVDHCGVAVAGPAAVADALVDADEVGLVEHPVGVADAVVGLFYFIDAFSVDEPFEIVGGPFESIDLSLINNLRCRP